MEFDFRALPPRARYKIMASCVTPRPIAWVTTLSADGIANAAPYSFFNVMGDDPPTLVLGMMRRGNGHLKDTAANILATGEFVVNLVGEQQAAAMNHSCIDAPPDVDELALADIATMPSVAVAPVRIALSPVSFECALLQTVEPGPGQLIVIGEILHAHVADRFVLDAAQQHIDPVAMGLIARMHGSGWYARSTDLFEIERPVYRPANIVD